MSVDIREEALTLAALAEYATIPIVFMVDRILEVRTGSPIPTRRARCSCCGGSRWNRRQIDAPLPPDEPLTELD